MQCIIVSVNLTAIIRTILCNMSCSSVNNGCNVQAIYIFQNLFDSLVMRGFLVVSIVIIMIWIMQKCGILFE